MNCILGLRQKQTQISGRGFHLRMSASASTREMGLRFFFLLTAFPGLPAHAGSFRLPSLIKDLTSLSLSKHQQLAFLGILNMLWFFPQPCLWSTSFPAGALARLCLPSGFSCPYFSDETSLPQRSLPWTLPATKCSLLIHAFTVSCIFLHCTNHNYIFTFTYGIIWLISVPLTTNHKPHEFRSHVTKFASPHTPSALYSRAWKVE